jgi:6,7-dimethyl-8-ribityllumazine synthase
MAEQMAAQKPKLDASKLRVACLVSRFNDFVTEKLLEGARAAFAAHGGDEARLDVAQVPGAFELPVAAMQLAKSGRYDAIVALGAVIRGETPHFEYVSAAASDGLSRVALETGLPVGFGLLTTDDTEQAEARAGGEAGNKGAEAMLSAIEMANLLKSLPKRKR